MKKKTVTIFFLLIYLNCYAPAKPKLEDPNFRRAFEHWDEYSPDTQATLKRMYELSPNKEDWFPWLYK